MNDDDVDKAMHDGGWAAWHANIATTIAKHGQMLIGVFSTPDEPGPGFTYTIGLRPQFGFELIIFGLPYNYAGYFLNELSDWIRNGFEIKDGVLVEELANLPLLVKEADHRARGYVCQADRYYEADVKTFQLVLPDKNGKFPGEKGYDEAYMSPRQPLLYDPV